MLCEDSLYEDHDTDGLDTTLGLIRLRRVVTEIAQLDHAQRLQELTRIASSKINRLWLRQKKIGDFKDKELEKKFEEAAKKELDTDRLREAAISCMERLLFVRIIKAIYDSVTRPKPSPFGPEPLTEKQRAIIDKNGAYRRKKDALENHEKRLQHARYSKERAYNTGEVRPRANGALYVGQLGNVW